MIKDGVEINNVQWQYMIKDNFSKLTFMHKKLTYVVKYIYAPNKDSHKENKITIFLQNIFDDTHDSDYDHSITMGDYNVALNHAVDTLGT